MKEGWLHVIPLLVLIIFLLVLKYNPEEAIVITIIALICCSQFLKNKENRLSLAKIFGGLAKSTEPWLVIGTITAAIGLFISSIILSGLGVKFSSFLIEISSGNPILILVFVAIACLILGMGLDAIPLYFTVAILGAPALVKTGMPEMVAHFFVIYWGNSSFITPPVCIAVYVTSAISGAGIWKTGGHAVRIGIGSYIISFAFALSPALLCMGSVDRIVITFLVTLFAAISIGCGTGGYCLKSLNLPQSLIMIGGGSLMVIPRYEVRIVALILIIACLFWQWLEKRHKVVYS